jgi:proline iminopeptidase
MRLVPLLATVFSLFWRQIKYPERVSELILRGIFLARKKEVAWTFLGQGANFIFPEEWDQFVNWIPKGERSDILEAYGRRLNGELGEEGKSCP